MDRQIIGWLKHTIEELEDIALHDKNLSSEDKKHLNGTILVLKRKLNERKQKS